MTRHCEIEYCDNLKSEDPLKSGDRCDDCEPEVSLEAEHLFWEEMTRALLRRMKKVQSMLEEDERTSWFAEHLEGDIAYCEGQISKLEKARKAG